ncbi:MAG: BTAD domain-containing putative transcriptional regulator, partial [Acidimicrobiales bacterium]
ITRIRLDSVARTAMTRLAELQLAGGEPEKALRWAAKAQSENALDERAGRLMILSLLATGDRAGAVTVANTLDSALHEAALAPEADTRRAFERVGIVPTASPPGPE